MLPAYETHGRGRATTILSEVGTSAEVQVFRGEVEQPLHRLPGAGRVAHADRVQHAAVNRQGARLSLHEGVGDG